MYPNTSRIILFFVIFVLCLTGCFNKVNDREDNLEPESINIRETSQTDNDYDYQEFDYEAPDYPAPSIFVEVELVNKIPINTIDTVPPYTMPVKLRFKNITDKTIQFLETKLNFKDGEGVLLGTHTTNIEQNIAPGEVITINVTYETSDQDKYLYFRELPVDQVKVDTTVFRYKFLNEEMHTTISTP